MAASNQDPAQSRVIRVIKIPLNLPLLKGDFNYPLWPPAHRASGPEGKGGQGGILRKSDFSKRIQQDNANYDVTLPASVKRSQTVKNAVKSIGGPAYQ